MTKTLEELKTDRSNAGAAYSAAALAYVNAYVELQAHELALSNAVVGDGMPRGFSDTPHVLHHPEFLRQPNFSHMGDRVRQRMEELIQARGA